MKRGRPAQTYCMNYHPFTDENTYWVRERGYLRKKCRICHRRSQKEYKRRNRRRLKRRLQEGDPK